jgi:hypothetical protein
MKITKRQRNKIIRYAIEKQPDFLCNSLRIAIKDILKVDIKFENRYKEIQKYIPEFKYSTAKKYFDTNADIKGPWWNSGNSIHLPGTIDNINRLKFLNYLLTGKLPKKVSKMKHLSINYMIQNLENQC